MVVTEFPTAPLLLLKRKSSVTVASVGRKDEDASRAPSNNTHAHTHTLEGTPLVLLAHTHLLSHILLINSSYRYSCNSKTFKTAIFQ